MSFLNATVGPALFPSVLWRTTERSMHLTFDDGPHPRATQKVLEILSKRQIRATFFLVGRSVQEFPNLAREIVFAGHSIGNHSLTHPVMFLQPREFQKEQVQRTNAVIEDILQLRPRGFRPPYGYFDFRTLKVAKAENQRVVMWDVDSQDFSDGQPNSVERTVSRHARPGSVILFHDNELTSGTVTRYLDSTLDRLVQRGCQFSLLPI